MLPSERTAITFWTKGFRAAVPGLANDLTERAALIAIGLYASGVRRRLLALSVAAAFAVEIGVLFYVRKRLS